MVHFGCKCFFEDLVRFVVVGFVLVLNWGPWEVQDLGGATGRFGEPGEEGGGERGLGGGQGDQGKVGRARES